MIRALAAPGKSIRSATGRKESGQRPVASEESELTGEWEPVADFFWKVSNLELINKN
jgi:hypothetical protein